MPQLCLHALAGSHKVGILHTIYSKCGKLGPSGAWVQIQALPLTRAVNLDALLASCVSFVSQNPEAVGRGWGEVGR